MNEDPATEPERQDVPPPEAAPEPPAADPAPAAPEAAPAAPEPAPADPAPGVESAEHRSAEEEAAKQAAQTSRMLTAITRNLFHVCFLIRFNPFCQCPGRGIFVYNCNG